MKHWLLVALLCISIRVTLGSCGFAIPSAVAPTPTPTTFQTYLAQVRPILAQTSETHRQVTAPLSDVVVEANRRNPGIPSKTQAEAIHVAPTSRPVSIPTTLRQLTAEQISRMFSTPAKPVPPPPPTIPPALRSTIEQARAELKCAVQTADAAVVACQAINVPAEARKFHELLLLYLNKTRACSAQSLTINTMLIRLGYTDEKEQAKAISLESERLVLAQALADAARDLEQGGP